MPGGTRECDGACQGQKPAPVHERVIGMRALFNTAPGLQLRESFRLVHSSPAGVLIVDVGRRFQPILFRTTTLEAALFREGVGDLGDTPMPFLRSESGRRWSRVGLRRLGCRSSRFLDKCGYGSCSFLYHRRCLAADFRGWLIEWGFSGVWHSKDAPYDILMNTESVA